MPKRRLHEIVASDKERYPLHHSVQEDLSADVERLIISKKLDVNEVDDSGHVPLYYAILAEKDYNVSVLLEQGAKINLLPQNISILNGKTLLEYYYEKRCSEYYSFLDHLIILIIPQLLSIDNSLLKDALDKRHYQIATVILTHYKNFESININYVIKDMLQNFSNSTEELKVLLLVIKKFKDHVKFHVNLLNCLIKNLKVNYELTVELHSITLELLREQRIDFTQSNFQNCENPLQLAVRNRNQIQVIHALIQAGAPAQVRFNGDNLVHALLSIRNEYDNREDRELLITTLVEQIKDHRVNLNEKEINSGKTVLQRLLELNLDERIHQALLERGINLESPPEESIMASTQDIELESKALLEEISTHFNYGSLNQQSALWAITSLVHSKKIDRTIKVVNVNDLQAYFFEAAHKRGVFEQVFIIVDKHWQSGLIKIDKAQQCNILLNDPMGKTWSYENVDLIKHAFRHRSYMLYANVTNRQQVAPGCAVFALDDARRLLNIHKYMPEIYQGDIFNYLACNIKSKKDGVYYAELPLYMLRTMRSRKLLSIVQAKTNIERQLPISKNGKTAEEHYEEDFKLEKDKKVNRLIMHQLEAMKKRSNSLCKNVLPMEIRTKLDKPRFIPAG